MLIIKKIDNLLYNELKPDTNFQLPKRLTVAKFLKKSTAYYTVLNELDVLEINAFFDAALSYDIKILDIGISPFCYDPLDYPANTIFITSNLIKCRDEEIQFPFWLDNIDSIPVPKNEILDPKIFFHSWMRIPRPHRIDLVNNLIMKDLISKGEIKISHYDDLYSVLEEDDSKRTLNITHNFIDFEKNKKYILDKVDGMANTNNANNAWQINYAYRYNRMLDVVAETTIEFKVPWISEKLWKPIRAGQLFLSWGVKGTVGCLRQQGFKTFDNYVDHSYDIIENNDLRLNTLTTELKRLSDLSEEEKIKIWKSTEKDRRFNRNYLRGNLYINFLQQLKEKILL